MRRAPTSLQSRPRQRQLRPAGKRYQRWRQPAQRLRHTRTLTHARTHTGTSRPTSAAHKQRAAIFSFAFSLGHVRTPTSLVQQAQRTGSVPNAPLRLFDLKTHTPKHVALLRTHIQGGNENVLGARLATEEPNAGAVTSTSAGTGPGLSYLSSAPVPI